MLFAKNSIELWPALGRAAYRPTFCFKLHLWITVPPPRDSGSLLENSRADFIHWSQDSHSPSFVLQGRDAAPTALLPHPASFCYTQMSVYTHTFMCVQYTVTVFVCMCMLVAMFFWCVVYFRTDQRFPFSFKLLLKKCLARQRLPFLSVIKGKKSQKECFAKNGNCKVMLPFVSQDYSAVSVVQ